MVQNVSNNSIVNSLVKTGQTTDGRVLFEIKDSNGKVNTRLSVAQKDCDVFEKSYNDMMQSVPKLQEYAEKAVSPDFQKHKKKQANRARWIGVGVGSAIPIILTRNLKRTWVQALLTLPGALVGLVGGSIAAAKILTPPGAKKFAKATETINRLDIKPYVEESNVKTR